VWSRTSSLENGPRTGRPDFIRVHNFELIRGQWPYSLCHVMSSVSANDAPVTRDTSVVIWHVHLEKDARRTKDRTRSEWTVNGSDNRTGACGVDEITWRPCSWSRFDGQCP